jgi:hypothetical protein
MLHRLTFLSTPALLEETTTRQTLIYPPLLLLISTQTQKMTGSVTRAMEPSGQTVSGVNTALELGCDRGLIYTAQQRISGPAMETPRVFHVLSPSMMFTIVTRHTTGTQVVSSKS